mmetsp:Transcript_22236/g.63217  ORF Transcript_22236/g.63217 Transcript_22236/m.63217 type:complete len:102 (+) Transcript_22236:1147-1452(+)
MRMATERVQFQCFAIRAGAAFNGDGRSSWFSQSPPNGVRELQSMSKPFGPEGKNFSHFSVIHDLSTMNRDAEVHLSRPLQDRHEVVEGAFRRIPGEVEANH